MDGSPFESDLALYVPDALEFLGSTDDDNGGGGLSLLGAVDAAEDFDASFLSELVLHGQSDNSSGSVRKESGSLGSTAPDTSTTSGSEFVASPTRPSSSPDCSTLVSASIEAKQTKKDTLRDRRLRRRAVSARIFRERKKNEMEVLHKEALALGVHLERLRSTRKMMQSTTSAAEWVERAMAQQQQRRQAEQLNLQLKRALFEQRRLVRGILGVLSSSPLYDSDINLHRILHTYVRLGSQPQGRIRAFKSICNDSRLDLALQVVNRETERVPIASPSISTQPIQTPPTECGVTTIAVHSFQTTDVGKIFSDAYLTIVGDKSMKEGHTVTNVHAEADKPCPQIHYSISDGVYTNHSTGQAFRTTSRAISFFRVTDEYSLLVWDFVDVDDRYPSQESIHMKTDVVGALIVRMEVCADAVERVVCRYVCTKMHRLNRLTATNNLERFIISGAQLCTESKFRYIEASNAARQVSVYV